jgi:transposase-like protein
MHTMPRGKLRPTLEEVKALLAADQDFLRLLVQTVLQELLEAETTKALGAEKGERTLERLGYRAGHYPRTLVTRVGKLELRVPQDRAGRFSTELFERYQRSEKALVAALAEMYVQGVSTRKVKAITEELCGHSFSAAAISAINARLDEELAGFARRRLDEACPYLIVDARYERVRLLRDGHVQPVHLVSTTACDVAVRGNHGIVVDHHRIVMSRLHDGVRPYADPAADRDMGVLAREHHALRQHHVATE